MPIVRPTSGSVITKASIQDMHVAVAALANAVPAEGPTPFGLGPQHLPGIVLSSGSLPNPNPEFIGTTPAPNIENAASIDAGWVEMANWQVTGASLPGGSRLLMYATLQQSVWIPNFPGSGNELFVTMYYRIGGVNSYPLWNIRAIPTEYAAAPVQNEENYKHVTIFDIYDVPAGASVTLNRIGMKAATYNGGGGAPPVATISNGSIGWINFRGP